MSDQPDAIVVPSGQEGYVYFVANKKARRFLNEGFDPRPRWVRTEGGEYSSPKYRSLEITQGPVSAALLVALHDRGLRAMVWCGACDCLHLVEGKLAQELKFYAISGAEGVSPAHGVTQ
jgi:hypothetical protein